MQRKGHLLVMSYLLFLAFFTHWSVVSGTVSTSKKKFPCVAKKKKTQSFVSFKKKFINRYPVSLNSLDDDEGKKNSSKAAPGAEIHEIATCSAV